MSQINPPSMSNKPAPVLRASRLRPHAQRAITNVVELAVSRFAEDLSMIDLAKAAEIPANSLTRIFNRRYGISPKRWVWYFRTVLAAELIAARPQWSLAAVASLCGFHSSAHFSRRFRDIFQETPTQYRLALRRAGQRGQPRHAGDQRFHIMIEDCKEATQRALASLNLSMFDANMALLARLSLHTALESKPRQSSTSATKSLTMPKVEASVREG